MFRQNETLKNLSHQAKAYFYCYRQNSPVSLLDITDTISRNNDNKKFIARVATLVRRVAFAKHILNEKVICNLSKCGLTKRPVLNKYIIHKPYCRTKTSSPFRATKFVKTVLFRHPSTMQVYSTVMIYRVSLAIALHKNSNCKQKNISSRTGIKCATLQAEKTRQQNVSHTPRHNGTKDDNSCCPVNKSFVVLFTVTF